MTSARWRHCDRAPDEDGSAAALVVVLAGVLATAAALVGTLGGAVADQRRVESAADLAALAAAGALRSGQPACSVAESVARRNGAALVDCVVDGEVVTVLVQRRTPAVLGASFTVRGRARAGPVTGPAPEGLLSDGS